MQTAKVISISSIRAKAVLQKHCEEQLPNHPLLVALLRDRLSSLNLDEDLERIFVTILKIDINQERERFNREDLDRFKKNMNYREGMLLHEHLKTCIGPLYEEGRKRISVSLLFDMSRGKKKPTNITSWQVHRALRIYSTARALCAGCKFDPRSPGQKPEKC